MRQCGYLTQKNIPYESGIGVLELVNDGVLFWFSEYPSQWLRLAAEQLR